MIHQNKFEERMKSRPGDEALDVVLHAIVVAAIRFVTADYLDNADHIVQITKTSRDYVILHAMDTLCVENLQALTIVAFDDVRASINYACHQLTQVDRKRRHGQGMVDRWLSDTNGRIPTIKRRSR